MVLPLLAAVGISAGASVLSSIIGGSAAKKAAAAQAKTAAENKALAVDYTGKSLADLDQALSGAITQYDQGESKATGALSPYATAGQGALSRLSDIYGLNGSEGSARGLSGFTESPGYQFRLNQGVQALDRSAAARGGLYSGAQGKALTEYGQGVGSQEWGNYVGGLTGLANSGQNAANGISGIATGAATGRANAMLGTAQNAAQTRASGLSAINGSNTAQGNATAGGITGQASAWNTGLNNLSQLAMFAGGYGGGNQGGGLSGYAGSPNSINSRYYDPWAR